VDASCETAGVHFDHVALLVPDIAAALAWWQRTVPDARVVYADDSWGLLEAGGARLAFVTEGEHPQHVAFKVSAEELDRLAGEHGADIAGHRDGSRSFYLEAPGHGHLEVIAYPDLLEEDSE
jgi:catechol 2,3-dioxygenase-like lactoylglutathione lyase family enzyme